MNKLRTLRTALTCLPILFFASCASQKTLKQYQDEVRTLREERTQLKKENRDLRSMNEQYETQLAEASMKPATAAPIADNPELDALGIEYGRDRFGNTVISIQSEITFSAGKAEITKKGEEALRAVARELKDKHATGKYWIEGHTDTDPIKKSKWESNRELSVARAMAVLSYLVEECEVPDSSCIVAGHGQYDPKADGGDAAAKARNRRVDIIVHRN
jgi:chemotaxis protein MotB